MPKNDKKHNAGAFVLAGVSFIPLIGVIPGLVCIVNALIRRVSNSKLLGGLGFAGVMVTVLIYGVILPNAFKSGKFSQGFEQHAISAMTSLVRNIEYFKLQNSRYPNSMEEIRANLKEGEMLFTYDVSGPMTMGEQQRDFYYEVINDGNNYLLFGVGVDAAPFTADDIYPLIDKEKDKNIGWLRNH
jgi:hypothetical protein